MPHKWDGTTIVYTFGEGIDEIRLDSAKLTDEVREACLKFGLKTILRNSTAGKMDDPAEGRRAMQAKVDLLLAGKVVETAGRKVKVELTEAEREEVIRGTIVKARRAAGDTRTDAEILTAFAGLPDERKVKVLTALAKAIEEGTKKALAEKKKLTKLAGKVDLGDWEAEPDAE